MIKPPTLLLDMDATIVEMTSVWLNKYYWRTGDLITEDQLTTWDFEKHVRCPQEFHDILAEKNFFFDLNPIPGAIEAIHKLMEKKFDIVILTQPPRRSKYAVNDKRRWIQKYVPSFDLKNIIFAHRKDLVKGAVIFDDSPVHLQNWKANWSDNITACIDYPYNRDIGMGVVDWRFYNKEAAWQQFYQNVCNCFKV